MSTRSRQVVGVVVAAAASAGAAVVTNVLTEQWSWVLWVSLGTLVIIGVSAQLVALRSSGDDRSAGVRGGGAGSVVIGGNNSGSIDVRVDRAQTDKPSPDE